MTNPYDILNIPQNASDSDIKKSYKKLAHKHHPDKGGDEEKFKEIQHAYDILKDNDKRKHYDTYGDDDNNTSSNTFDPFSMFFNMHNMNRRKRKCQNIIINVNYTLEQLYRKDIIHKKTNIDVICNDCNGVGGTELKRCVDCGGDGVKIITKIIGMGMMQQTQQICDKCDGVGNIVSNKCLKCDGNKVVKRELNFNVSVDPSIENGKQLLYQGKGNQYPDQEQGDIIFLFIEDQHPIFKRLNNCDLYIKKEINLIDALCGSTFKILHLDNREIEISINTIVKPNSKKIIQGEGLHQQSNLIIEFDIIFPPNIVQDRNNLEKLLKI